MANDGTVRITIEADGNKAIKTAKDLESVFNGLSKTKGTDGINKSLDETARSGGKARVSIMDMAASMGVVKVASAAFNVLKSNVAGAVQRFDTLNRYPVVMKALGYSAKDTNKSMKLLNKGIDGLPTSLDEITSSSQQFATLTGSATSGAKAALALNDAFLASGASSADASRGMVQYTQMLSSGKVDMMSWRTLMETMPSSLDKVAKSFGLTGKSAKMDLYNKLQSGEITIDQLNDRFVKLDGGVGGFAKMARKNSAGIGTSFTNMSNSIKKGLANTLTAIDDGLNNAGLPGIAESFNNMKDVINTAFTSINAKVTQTIPPIINTIKGLVSFVQKNKDWLEPLVVGIGSFAVALKVVRTAKTAFSGLKAAMTVGKVVSQLAGDTDLLKTALANMSKESKLAALAQEALNVAQSLSPTTWIIIGIMALVAALVWFFTQTKTGKKIVEDVTKAIQNAWNKTASFLSQLFKKIAKAANDIWNGYVDYIKSVINGFKNAWSGVVSFFSGIVTGIQNVWNGITTFFSNLWNGIVQAMMPYWQSFLTSIQPIVDAFMNLWSALSSFFSTLWNGIVSIAKVIWSAFVSYFNSLITTITSVWITISSFFSGLWQSIVNISMSIWQGIVTFMTPIIQTVQVMWSGLVAFFAILWQSIVTVATAIWSGLVAYFTFVWTTIVTIATTIWNMLQTVISTAINVIMVIIQTVLNVIVGIWSVIWNSIVAVVTTIWNIIVTAISTAINVLAGIINVVTAAIQGNWTAVWNSIKGIATTIWNGINKVITSVMNGIRAVVSSVLNGIRGIWSSVWNGIKSVASSIWNGIKSVITIAINGIKSVINGIRSVIGSVSSTFNSIKSAMVAPIQAAKGIIDGIINGIKNAINGVKNIGGSIKKKLGFSLEIPSIDNGAGEGPGQESTSPVSAMSNLANSARTMMASKSMPNFAFAGITPETFSGINTSARPTNSVVNNYQKFDKVSTENNGSNELDSPIELNVSVEVDNKSIFRGAGEVMQSELNRSKKMNLRLGGQR
ncbi:tape measure protein [Companilactobacillus sp. DQM5]|uniref:tape measure protein n=1 Tax=Companilactobacillus sp. DQM5 TaxID=3463359 RepID=UPI004058A089